MPIPGPAYYRAKFDDPAADVMAERLGGASSIAFVGKFDEREFDFYSEEYIGQTKPANFQFGSGFRRQAKGTFEAAVSLGKVPYFHFEGPPGPGVIEKLREYAVRYGIGPVIDISPL